MLQNKKINILISVIIAFGLWFYVSGSISPDTTKKFKDIKVHLVNQNSLIEAGYAVESIEPKTIDITIIGSRSAINDLKEEDIKVNADVYSRYKGKNYIGVDVSLPKGLKVENKSTDRILINIDTLVSEDKPIELVSSEELPQDSVLVQNSIEPSKVKVYGTRNNVNKVINLKANLSIKDFSSDNFQKSAKLVPVDKNGNEVDFVSLSSDEVNVTAGIEKHKKVSLEVKTKGKVGEGSNISSLKYPETIEIQGKADVLKSISSISSEEINLEDIKENSKIKIPLILPEGIKLKEGSEEPYLTVNASNVSSVKYLFQGNEIEVKNLPRGLKIKKPKEEIAVIISSQQNKNVSFSKNDISLWIDMSNASVGTGAYQIFVKEIVGYTIEVKPLKISVEVLEE